MRHGAAAPFIVLGTWSKMSDVISKLIRAGEETYWWNSSKTGNVRLGCLEKSTSATSVSVFTPVPVGRRRTPFSRPVKRRTSCISTPGGALGRRPSGYAPLSHIADMLAADNKLSLSCLMTEPCVAPSPTSPWNVPGAGGCTWNWWPPSCDGGRQWKILAFHPGTKGSKQLWLCAQAKNACG